MAVWAAALIIYGGFLGVAKSSAGPASKVPLDLAPNAVDDMYAGCKGEMENRVREEYLMKEKNTDRNSTLAWTAAEKYYDKTWRRKKGKRPPTLGKERIMALYVYSLDRPNVSRDFSDAVRTQRSEYRTTFRYHALHFLLSDALQTLNALPPAAARCLIGFRRVRLYFSQDVLNKEIRFGSFTPGWMGRYPSPEKFGDKSCFEITTCFGADVSLYWKFGELERVVLIPPYEVFKVTKLERRSGGKRLPCEVVYTVVSTGKLLSNLNCALF